ncbi:PEP-CTERM sorting domain-containing protein [Luteolibacter algae]|uniref:PEP-CTERM sorting domain-containing protein n=1 Tax=Luteolibacter algae TaxID=454151 RepID=A0ABW5D3Y2_9BACT
MKISFFAIATIGALIAHSHGASTVITGITTSEGWTNGALNSGVQTLTGITTASGSSTSVTFATGFTGDPGTTNGTYAETTTFPGYTAAQTDSRVDTGALNVGDGDEYTWSTSTIGSGDAVFVIFNGATGNNFGAPDSMRLTDGAGNFLGNAVALSIAESDAFGRMNLARDQNSTLANRNLYGVAVPVADFGVADLSQVKGVKFGTVLNNNDFHMVGFAAVPEPSGLALLGLGGLALFGRRRR